MLQNQKAQLYKARLSVGLKNTEFSTDGHTFIDPFEVMHRSLVAGGYCTSCTSHQFTDIWDSDKCATRYAATFIGFMWLKTYTNLATKAEGVHVNIIKSSNVCLTLLSTLYCVILVRQPRVSTRYVRHPADST